MSYQEFAELPAFELGVFNGQREPSVSGLPTWSRSSKPPKKGDVVDVRMNAIGLSLVVGYFVLEGYLGLRVKPFEPPAWFVKQNGYNATGHVFGAEIAEGFFEAPVLNGPNQEQLAALQKFASATGRLWKSALSLAWETGADEGLDDSGLLRQVRNQFGPTWLYSDRNPVKSRKS